MNREPLIRLLLLLLCAGGAVSCVTTGDGGGAGDIVQPATAWMKETTTAVGRFFTDDAYRARVQASASSWFGGLNQTIQSGSIEQLASRADEARAIAAWGSRYESMTPYADWLAARVDYFEAAQAAVARVPDPAPPRVTTPTRPRPAATVRTRSTVPYLPPPPPPPRPTTGKRPLKRISPPLPPPRPSTPEPAAPPPAVAPETASRRARAATSSDYWRAKAASHARPSRADDLLPLLRRAFLAEGVPECLLWVAEVESTFNPEARSPAGAVGLFQLMPATARSLGLRLEPDDERRDPERNARAAARYFRQLYRRFGSWPLVLAAYNAGETRVARALRQNGDRSYDAIAPQLPLETRMYVPRVLETVRLRSGVAPEAIPGL